MVKIPLWFIVEVDVVVDLFYGLEKKNSWKHSKNKMEKCLNTRILSTGAWVVQLIKWT